MINDPAKLNRLVKGVPTLRKLLVIDDNSLVRFALCLLLRRAGYEVLEASDGGEGQQVQSENDLDLLITDILMDGVDGLETIRKIREVSPDIKIIAPWREWDLNSRTKLIEYARENQIPVPKDKEGEAPYSTDANLLHISYEGKALEDPWVEPAESMFTRSVNPADAPDQPTVVEIEFYKGDPVAVDGEKLSPAALLETLNRLGGANGVGRQDIVENRFVGMKSRGVYETPGGTVLFTARRAMESLTLDSGAMHLKDELMPRYAETVYNGFWFSPEREIMQAAIDKASENVTGMVRLKLFKGSVIVTGRKSHVSLYSEETATFEADSVYDQRDAEGFIKLNALRLRLGKNASDKKA